MATGAVEGAINGNGVVKAGGLSANPPFPAQWEVKKAKKPTAVDAKKHHERQHSLRHANSVELTHRRLNSSGSTHAHPTEAAGGNGARAGRQFTVANVGNNGMIFLR